MASDDPSRRALEAAAEALESIHEFAGPMIGVYRLFPNDDPERSKWQALVAVRAWLASVGMTAKLAEHSAQMNYRDETVWGRQWAVIADAVRAVEQTSLQSQSDG